MPDSAADDALPKTPSFRLDGKRALVTGASRGLGRACAAALAEAGACVVLAARGQDALERVADEIAVTGGRTETLALDIAVVERTREFNGRYHVLGGALSPIDGIGPAQLRIEELGGRLPAESVTELIVATNPTIEGDTTAMYLARRFKPLGVTVTRPASGLPVGGDMDYADEITLGRALTGRRTL